MRESSPYVGRHKLKALVSRRGTGGGRCRGAAMPRLVATADRVDYWIRRRVVPCPAQASVNPALHGRVGLTAMGQCLKDQYDAVTTPMPAHLAALVEQLEMQE